MNTENSTSISLAVFGKHTSKYTIKFEMCVSVGQQCRWNLRLYVGIEHRSYFSNIFNMCRCCSIFAIATIFSYCLFREMLSILVQYFSNPNRKADYKWITRSILLIFTYFLFCNISFPSTLIRVIVFFRMKWLENPL